MIVTLEGSSSTCFFCKIPCMSRYNITEAPKQRTYSVILEALKKEECVGGFSVGKGVLRVAFR